MQGGGRGSAERVEDLVGEGEGGRLGANRLEMRSGAIGVGREAQVDGLGSRGRAMLESQAKPVAMTSEIRIVVPERVQVARSTEGLSEMGADAFSHVVDEENRDGVSSLRLAQKAEERGDIGTAVFVQTMKPDQRIEEQKLGPEPSDGGVEALLIVTQIESDGGCGDDVEREAGQVESSMVAEGDDALAHARQGVLGEVDEGGARVVDGEAIEAWGAGGDAQGEVESEETLRAFWLAAAKPDGLPSPDIAHEPLGAGLGGGQVVCAQDGQLGLGGHG